MVVPDCTVTIIQLSARCNISHNTHCNWCMGISAPMLHRNIGVFSTKTMHAFYHALDHYKSRWVVCIGKNPQISYKPYVCIFYVSRSEIPSWKYGLVWYDLDNNQYIGTWSPPYASNDLLPTSSSSSVVKLLFNFTSPYRCTFFHKSMKEKICRQHLFACKVVR